MPARQRIVRDREKPCTQNLSGFGGSMYGRALQDGVVANVLSVLNVVIVLSGNCLGLLPNFIEYQKRSFLCLIDNQ